MDFAQARKNMVDCQIKPSGVIDDSVIEAFANTPREMFLDEELRALSYADCVLQPAPYRALYLPMHHARLLEALDLDKTSVVLDVGTGCGYNAAILSQLCSTVISIETDKALLAQAQLHWDQGQYCNIAGVQVSDLAKGYAEGAPYDAIFISGAMSYIPQIFCEQLKDSGKIVCVEKASAGQSGCAKALRKSQGSSVAGLPLFECDFGYLEGFEPVSSFKFA